jgi:gliding motility-associated-like protein
MLLMLLCRLRLLPGLVFLLLVVGIAGPAQATHLLGGEMTYRYLDSNGPKAAPLRYEITVIVYNNCANTAIRPAANVGIYDQATGTRVLLTTVNYAYVSSGVSGQSGIMSIPQTSISACIAPVIPPGCTISGVSQPYQLQKFVGIVNLPVSTEGYYALFTDGNRNVDITNLQNPGNLAMTLYTALAVPQLPNHSPVFSDVAVAVICANDTTFLLNNAVDADGDRLVYSFGQPYATGNGLGVVPPSFIPPPLLVPYAYGAGYSSNTPFGTTKGNLASIEPSTGIAKYSSTTVGSKYAVAIDVAEYRTIDGREVLIGTTRRDLQLVVALCPQTKAPILPPPTVMPRNYTVEAGSTLTIPITATQADGHPLVMTLNSVLLDGPGGYSGAVDGNPGTLLPGYPSGTASVSGTGGTVTGTLVFNSTCTSARTTPYDVAFTVKDNGCAGKTAADVLHITVTKPKGPTTIKGDQTVCTLNSVHTYKASGGTAPGISWRVVGGTVVGSSTADSVQVNWAKTGKGMLVARGITQYGCLTDSVTQNVTIGQATALGVSGSLTVCKGSSTTLTITGGTAPYTVTGGPTPLSVAGQFEVSPAQTTTYTIMSAAPAGTCGGSAQVTVTVPPPPAAIVGPATRSACSGEALPIGTAAVAGNTYSWSPTTGLSSATSANPTVTLTNTTGAPITQTYTLTETNGTNGCKASNSVAITVNPAVVAAPGAAVTVCSGSAAQLGTTPSVSLTYSWSPATGLSSTTVANPTATLVNTTGAPITQTYTLTATNTSTGCVGTATVAVTVNPPPAVVPGAAVTVCAGSTGQLGGAPVAGFTYSWSPATGLSSTTVANPTVTLPNTTGAPITQTYTLTATNGTCAGTATVTVTVNPLPVATPGVALAICSGNSTQLGAPPVAGLVYSWSPATGLSSTTVANPTVTLTNATSAATTQAYTLTVTNPATSCTSTGTVVVTVNSAVVPGTIGANKGASQTVCVGAVPAQLTSTAEASGGTGTYAYQWESSLDNVTWAAIAGATNASYSPGPVVATTYYRRQVISGTCNTAASNVVSVQTQPTVVATVQLPTPPTECAGTALTFTPAVTNAGATPTYRWFVNNTQVATTPTYTSTTLANGDQVRVELTPTAGLCTTGAVVATATVTRTPVTLPTVAISLRTALPVCVATPLTFGVDNITNPGPTLQYQWQIDGTNVAGAQAATFTTSQLRDGQIVTLTVRTAATCGLVTVTSNAVRATINPAVEVKAGPDKTIMEGDQVTLEGQANGNYALAWTPTQTLTFPGNDLLHPIAAPLVTTTYTLSATAGKCNESSTVTVTVTPRLRIPNAFSPNGDGRDDTWEIDHIGDYSSNHILVFNRWGNKIFETSNYRRGNEWDGAISGQPAPTGTYYYVITLGNGKSYSGSLTLVY